MSIASVAKLRMVYNLPDQTAYNIFDAEPLTVKCLHSGRLDFLKYNI